MTPDLTPEERDMFARNAAIAVQQYRETRQTVFLFVPGERGKAAFAAAMAPFPDVPWEAYIVSDAQWARAADIASKLETIAQVYRQEPDNPPAVMVLDASMAEDAGLFRTYLGRLWPGFEAKIAIMAPEQMARYEAIASLDDRLAFALEWATQR